METNDARDISIAGIVSATLSIIGCVLVILSYFAYPSCRTFKSRLVVYLSVADLAWTIPMYSGLIWYLRADDTSISANDWIPEGSCVASGFFLQWFIVSSTLWVSMISIYVYCLIVHNYDLKNREWVMHVIGWVVPLGFAMIPWGTKGQYGPAGTWCWVEDPWARLGLSYAFVWSNLILIIVLYALIARYIWQHSKQVGNYLGNSQKDARTKKMQNVFKKLILYPIVYLIQWVPGSVNRVQNAVNPDHPIVALFVVHVLFVMSGGFLNFLAYGIGKRKTIRKVRPFSTVGMPKPVDTDSATVTTTTM